MIKSKKQNSIKKYCTMKLSFRYVVYMIYQYASTHDASFYLGIMMAIQLLKSAFLCQVFV